MLKELGNLQDRRVELKEELHSLTAKEKTLEENVKMLELKLAIQKSCKNIKVKREAVNKLESKRSELEKKLNESEASEVRLKENEKPSLETEKPEQPREQRKEKKKHRFF